MPILIFLLITVLIAVVPSVIGTISLFNYKKKFGKKPLNTVPTPSGYMTYKDYQKKYKDYRNGEIPHYALWYIFSFSILLTGGAVLLAALLSG